MNSSKLKYLGFFGAIGLTMTSESLDAKQPNILLIMTDQQSGQALSSSGAQWVDTPAMDTSRSRIIFAHLWQIIRTECLYCFLFASL